MGFQLPTSTGQASVGWTVPGDIIVLEDKFRGGLEVNGWRGPLQNQKVERSRCMVYVVICIIHISI